jgi:hypothetical protein
MSGVEFKKSIMTVVSKYVRKIIALRRLPHDKERAGKPFACLSPLSGSSMTQRLRIALEMRRIAQFLAHNPKGPFISIVYQ